MEKNTFMYLHVNLSMQLGVSNGFNYMIRFVQKTSEIGCLLSFFKFNLILRIKYYNQETLFAWIDGWMDVC